MPRLDVLSTHHTRAPLPPVDGPGSSGGSGQVQTLRRHAEALHGTTSTNQLGGVRISLIEGQRRELIRPSRHIDPYGPGYLRLCRPLAGDMWVSQDGRHALVRPPHLVCVDTTRSFRMTMPGRFRVVEMLMGHTLMGVTPEDAALLTAQPWPGTHGVAALLSRLLDGLEQHGKEVGSTAGLLGGSVAGLGAALFAERMRSVAADPDIAKQSLMLRIQAFIREHLAEPGLSPTMVARRYSVSVRYLQKIFQEYGTSPARWIRDERLARCHAELGDQALDHLPVALIGERAGLYGASHFSRLFRDRYGITPRDYRKERAAV